MAVPVDQFGKALIASGLMTADEIKALWNALAADDRPKDGEGFARHLIKLKKLTDYQAKELLVGRGSRLVMGDYVILQEIGAGGMGQVYKARHRRMERIVALKVMSAAAMKDESSVKRFQREVRAAARLEHPNIVTAYDSGEAGSVKYLVMQFVDGGDLADLVKKKGPLEVERAVDYVLQTARGLAFAHANGVIHRDIKPANLLLNKDGVVKILDMGLARLEDVGDGLTATEQVMGTVDYMSPEQATETKNADARSDIYSLGCTLWYLLAGKKLYEGDTMISRLMKHRDSPLPSLVRERDDASWPLEQTLHKMIAKRADDRFQSMTDVVEALEPFAPRSGSRSNIIGSAPQNAELSAFLKTVGPATKHQTKPAPATTNAEIEATTRFSSAPGDDTDPKSGLLSKSLSAARGNPRARDEARRSGRPRMLTAIGIAGFALTALIAWLIAGDKSSREVGRIAVSQDVATVVTAPSRVATAPVPTPSAPVTSFFTTSGSLPSFLTADPKNDHALLFDGVDDFAEVSDVDLTPDGSQPFTLEAVIVLDRPPAAACSIAGWNGRFQMWIESNLALTSAAYTVGKSTRIRAASAPGSVPIGKPIHVAAVWDRSSLRTFLDGVLCKITALGSADFESTTTKKPFVIGAKKNTPEDVTEFFPGRMLELRVSRKARYTQGFTAPTSLNSDFETTALYRFDEETGDVLRDASGNRRNAKIIGAKWIKGDGSPAAPPPGDYALKFDGVGAVEFDEPWPYDVDCCTVESIVRVDQHIPKGVIFALSDRGYLGLDHSKGEKCLMTHPFGPKDIESVGGHYNAGTLRPVELNRRLYLAGVYDKTEFRFYLDGRLQPRMMGPKEGRPFPLGIQPPKIGSEFRGIIDELRISKSVRYTADYTPVDRLEPDAHTVALYHCDEGAGRMLLDSSGNNRHGRIVSATWVLPDGSPIPSAPVTDAATASEVDLLSGLDVVGNAVAGKFALDANGLRVTDKTLQARIYLPTSHLPPEYDFKLRVQRIGDGGQAFAIGFVRPGEQGMIIADGYSSPAAWALESVDGQSARTSGMLVPGSRLSDKAPHDITVRVRNDGISALCDDVTVIDWKGKPGRLTPAVMWQVPQKDQLFVGFQGPYAVHAATLKPVNAPQPAPAR